MYDQQLQCMLYEMIVIVLFRNMYYIEHFTFNKTLTQFWSSYYVV